LTLTKPASAREALEAFFQNASFGIVVKDTPDKIAFINQQARQLLDMSADTDDAALLEALLPPEDSPRTFQVKVLGGRQIAILKTNWKLDGNLQGEVFVLDECSRYQFFSDTPVPIGIDQKLKTVLEGCLTAKSLNPIFDSFYDGIMIVKDEKIVKVNNSMSQITGLKSIELLGQNVEDLDGEKHVCLHTIQKVNRLANRF